jgi:hypothetical protein
MDMDPHVPTEAHCSRDISIAPGNRTEVHLLRFHRFVKTRVADPPGVLTVLRHDFSLGGKFLQIPGAFLPAGIG